MASGSPRNRIDQFFVSKKRKNVSPISKSGRSEKGGRHTDEGSPSAEGSLDNYLVTSEDNFNARLYRTGDSLVRQDIVKRNLAADINCSLDNDYKQPVSSAQGHEVSDATIREIVNELPKLADVVMGDPALKDNCSDCRQDVESLELKQFAAGLLSLYCSEFQSRIDSTPGLKVDDHERHGTSTLLKRKISVPQKLCNTSGESHIGEENISSDEKLEDIKSGIVGDAAGPAFGLSTKVSDCDDTTATEARLRRCSNITKPSTNVAECYTPGSLIVKACVQETPKSTCGSSMFSPGEAFWNEAIQLADGLCAPMANDSSHASENLVEDQPNMKNSCNVRNHDGKPRRTLDQSEIGIRNMEKGTPLRLSGKHTKDSVKEVSPLPVKHFDFSFEDNYLDESTALPCHADDLMNDKQYKFNSFNCKDIKVSKNFIIGGTSYTNEKMNEVQEVASVDAVCKKDMLSNQKTDSLAYNSPHNKVRTVIGAHESDETATPSSSVSRNDSLDLSSWLPCEICRIYRKKGISKLYNWQVDCLKVDGVMLRRNLVYCASTSAGKSFVAEILMLRRVILTAKMALLVLPYVSICAEKAEHLELLLEPLGKHVRSYYGNQGGGTLPKDTSVAVCTIEKANSLINRLLEEGRLSELGIIVIDELHMVGDPSRGYLLELLLTKLRYAAGEGNLELSGGESSGGSSNKADPAQGLQIVGMSATMPNVAAVADWLQAALYQTEFRPVPLEEFIKVGNSIYNKSMELARTISKVADLGGKDPDHVVELCNEVVQEGNSVLIFCSSRKGCESTARHVAKFLKKFTVDVHENNCEFADITSAIDSLRKCPAGLDPILEETLPSGVAFHHAGLTVEEREIVETCYRRGLLRVLTATSTLAAGVNLPARRVIFRQPRIGRDFIDGTRYKQMAGRAGRTGIDTKGESVLICKPEEIKKVMGLLNESCPPLHSCLSEDMNGMTHAILEVVAGGIVQTANDIHRYVRCTLLNSTKPFQDVVKSAQESLKWLCQRKFLEWNEDTKLYSTTPLGRASFGSSLCPKESLVVLADLSRAREGFVLASDLHLVYLVTPINVDVEPDWELYYERFMQLSPLD